MSAPAPDHAGRRSASSGQLAYSAAAVGRCPAPDTAAASGTDALFLCPRKGAGAVTAGPKDEGGRAEVGSSPVSR